VLTFTDVVAAHEEIDENELDFDNEFNTEEEDTSDSDIDSNDELELDFSNEFNTNGLIDARLLTTEWL